MANSRFLALAACISGVRPNPRSSSCWPAATDRALTSAPPSIRMWASFQRSFFSADSNGVQPSVLFPHRGQLRAIGLTVPRSVLVQATEVID